MAYLTKAIAERCRIFACGDGTDRSVGCTQISQLWPRRGAAIHCQAGELVPPWASASTMPATTGLSSCRSLVRCRFKSYGCRLDVTAAAMSGLWVDTVPGGYLYSAVAWCAAEYRFTQ